MVDALQSLGQILQPHKRSLEHVCHIDSLAVAVDNIALSIARHPLVPRGAIFRAVHDLCLFVRVLIGRSKADDDILETKTPGVDVVVVDSLRALGPGE